MEELEELSTPIEYMLTCCLCNSLVQHPVLLNCLHTCCRQCFSIAASGSANGDVACGACSTITQAGTERQNRFVDSQVLLYSTEGDSRKCGVCRNRKLDKNSVVWCSACRISLCADCAEWHEFFKEDHSTEKLSETESSEVLSPNTLFSACLIHKVTLDACIDCQQLKCRHCSKECSDKQHTIRTESDESFINYVENLIGSIYSTENELHGKLEHLQRPHTILSSLRSARADHMQRIMNRKLHLLEAVTTMYHRIESSTKQAYRELEIEAARAAAETDRIESNFANARSYFRRLKDSNRKLDIFDQHGIIEEHMKVLCAELELVSDAVNKIGTINIDPSLPDDLEAITKAWIKKPFLRSDGKPHITEDPRLSDVVLVESVSDGQSADPVRMPATADPCGCTSKYSKINDQDEKVGHTLLDAAEQEPKGTFEAVTKTVSLFDICHELENRLDSLKDVEINIGVIGASGSGKSTLINTLRRIDPWQPGAAMVGVVETTLEPTAYSYPNDPRLKLWDLPGFGTMNFRRENYLRAINFEKYDFFLIVTSCRFTETDLWFASKVQKAGKNFYLVRTKIDIDIRNEQEDSPETFNQENFLAAIRKYCTMCLTKEVFGDVFVALVCRNADSFDLPKLEEKMKFDRIKIKREAVLSTLRTSTLGVIEEKQHSCYDEQM